MADYSKYYEAREVVSRILEQVWIDNKLVINNEGAVKAGTNSDNSVS